MKKILCILLTFVMVTLSFVSVTFAFNDISLTDNSYEAIKVLSDLDILKGDESGNFNPNNKVKRSELAAILCRTLGQENAATSTVSKFNDVATNHWAVGYISWAAGKGIVNGYGDGNFKPDNDVTYQEAVKMLMCAMGYGPLAESESYGGYPYGYLSLAGTYGVTDGLSADPTAAAPRSLVAQLVANALDAPLVGKGYTAFGEAYNIYDGKKAVDYEERTILSQYLDIIKVEATVVNNYKSNEKLLDAKTGKAAVELGISKIYNRSDRDFYGTKAEDGNGDLNDLYPEGAADKVWVGDTNASDYLSTKVDAYLIINEDEEFEIKAIIPSAKASRSITVDKDFVAYTKKDAQGKDVLALADGLNADKSVFTFKYWEDIENDSKPAEEDIDVAATVYVNGTNVKELYKNGTFNAVFEAIYADNFTGSVELVASTKSGNIDNIFITTYKYAMVEEVRVEDEAIVLKDGYIELGEDYNKKGFVYNIYKDGEAIELADIKEDDVLTFIWPGGDDSEALFVDIYVSDATVTGTVTGAKSTGDVFYIDRVEYKPVAGKTLKVGDEGIFFLTHDGKIFDSKATSSLSDNYAYILKVGKSNSFDGNYQIRVFQKDGSIATYTIADKVKVSADFDDKGVVTETYSIAEDAAKQQSVIYDYINGLLKDVENEEDAKEAAAKRLITFATSGDEINKISFAATTGKEGEDFNYEETSGNYRATTSKLGKYYFEETASLFYAPVTVNKDDKYGVDVEDVALMNFDSLDEDKENGYNVYAYAIEDRYMGAALIVDELEFAGRASALAVVTSIATGLNSEGEKASTITVFQGGQKADYVLDEDMDELYGDELVAGDIVQFVVNGAGEIAQLELIYDYEAGELNDEVKTTDKIKFVTGYVLDYKNGGIGLAASYDKDAAVTDYIFNYEEGCTLAMVDVAKADTSSFVKGLSSTSAFKYTEKNSTKPVQYFMEAKVVDDDIVDAVEYNMGIVAFPTTEA